MSKPITVRQLKELCEEEIKKGNGEKVIMISSDDEGNCYHYLWYPFIEATELLEYGISEFIITDIETTKNTIILG